MAEIVSRIQTRYPQKLMNDTKWREVWTLIAASNQRLRMKYADSDVWNSDNADRLHGPFPADYVLERGIRDPGIGGPFTYAEIYSLEIPKSNPGFDMFCKALGDLGVLPITEHDTYIEILGYR